MIESDTITPLRSSKSSGLNECKRQSALILGVPPPYGLPTEWTPNGASFIQDGSPREGRFYAALKHPSTEIATNSGEDRQRRKALDVFSTSSLAAAPRHHRIRKSG